MVGFDDFRESVGRQTTESLLGWISERRPGSPQQIAASAERSRRDELTRFKRFWMGFAVVALLLILGTLAVIRHWW